MENLQKDFLHYELALKMKQLGFDEPCLGYWRNEDLPNPITIGQYTTKEDIEYEISGQDEYHNFKNIIALAISAGDTSRPIGCRASNATLAACASSD